MRRVLLVAILVGMTVLAGYVFTIRLLGERSANVGNIVVIEMTMRQWRFDVVSISPPGSATFTANQTSGRFADTTIKVHKGDTVVLRITNLDVAHGFGLVEFGVNVVTPPGQITEVKFIASQAGVFTFFCTVFCGTGHPNHKGTLIVVG